jgi:hypothetical protein
VRDILCLRPRRSCPDPTCLCQLDGRVHAGLGRATVKHLLRTGEYHVIGAVRDLEKVSPPPSASTLAVPAVSALAHAGLCVLNWQMEAVAEMDELDMENFTPMLCDLNGRNSQSTLSGAFIQ